MESFFFNLTDSAYKIEYLYKDTTEFIKRVDISNGIVFLDLEINVTKQREYNFKNLDRMLVICVIQEGSLKLHDNINNKTYSLTKENIYMFVSSKQDLKITFSQYTTNKIFTLCIADFILKRYLSKKENSVIDHLYNTLQQEISLQQIDKHPIDALSLYIIQKIKSINTIDTLSSLACEHHTLEFILHRFKLLDIYETPLKDEEICISRSAKEILVKSFVNPPTITLLAHMCATNETKLKTVFKKRYKTTIYAYIQMLRLQKANLLLREQHLTIGEIAKAVGYKHQGNFSKLFFEHYGVYPKDILKK
ncbi:MAG: helix-turn-helix transcriptional regulator [Epsilonproteobacteria bacterium]|nr:helix-turn-helix transcriptional regulator [Campylobacterota bacterium]